jgi:hypothetical protein
LPFQHPQLVPHRARQSARTGTTEPRIDGFESPDEVEYLGAGIRASRRRAEVGAASKGAVLINHTGAVFAQHRTRAVVALGHRLSSGSSQSPRGQHRLAPRELRRASGELEMAALSAADARALDGAVFQFPVDGADFFECLATEDLGLVGRSGKFFWFHFKSRQFGLAAKEHKELKKNGRMEAFCFVETVLTGRYEIMKTGRKRRLVPSQVQFHVFMISYFSVK